MFSSGIAIVKAAFSVFFFLHNGAKQLLYDVMPLFKTAMQYNQSTRDMMTISLGRCLQMFFFSFSNVPTKLSVSDANRFLFGTLMSIGGVNDIFVVRPTM